MPVSFFNGRRGHWPPKGCDASMARTGISPGRTGNSTYQINMFPLQWRDNNIGTPELADSAFSIGLRLFASSCGFYFIICRVRTSSSSSHCRGMRLWQLVLRIKQSVGMARTCSRLGIFTATSSSRRKLCRRFCLFLPRDAMQAWPIPSCGVRPSVRPSVHLSVRHVRGFCRNEQTYLQNFSTVG